MSGPISSVVKIATSVDQAKVFVAMLKAEGIPAFVDGDNAADEFAMSQRLMNMTNVKVMVPTSALEQAREILAPLDISEEELDRQAREAGENDARD